MTLRPSKLSLEQVKKIVRAMAYVAVSSMITSLLTYVTKNPELFGVFYAPVNFALIFLKQLFTNDTESTEE